MPCYDKKLEASRQDFYNDIYRTREVDLVLSTAELDFIMQDKSVNILNVPSHPYESLYVLD
jgi:iron only hydrogenase large subunit-like protein